MTDTQQSRRGHADVLVAGAGPTGMVTALVLAANGVSSRILERRPSPSGSSRALGLQARSMELLAALGLADDIERVAYRLSGASMMRGDTELTRLAWVPPQSSYPYTYVLPQAGLEELLRERLRSYGVEIEYGAEVAALSRNDDRVAVRLTDGRIAEAAWLVGADGSRSRVRAELDIEFAGGATGETYYLADIVPDAAPPFQDSAMWLGPDGPLMLMRLPGSGELWRLFVDMTDAVGADDPAAPSDADLQRILDERGPSRTRIARVDWTSVFRTRVCLAGTYRRGSVFLAGDAAHVFPPFGGQGMNLGIQDAVGLAWRLARVVRGAAVEILDDYEIERRPVAAATIRDVERRRQLYALRNPLARTLRDTALRVGARVPGAARRASVQNSQLDTSYYRASRRPFAPRPGRGDRAPDAALADGTVHDRFGVGHLTLLQFGAAADIGFAGDASVPTVSVRIDDRTDPMGAARARYRMRGPGYVLVRPDGYVAYRGTDAADIRRTVARLATTIGTHGHLA